MTEIDCETERERSQLAARTTDRLNTYTYLYLYVQRETGHTSHTYYTDLSIICDHPSLTLTHPALTLLLLLCYSLLTHSSVSVRDGCTHYSILSYSSKYPKRYPQGHPPVHQGHSSITFHNSFLILLTRTAGTRPFECFVSCVEIHLDLRPRYGKSQCLLEFREPQRQST